MVHWVETRELSQSMHQVRGKKLEKGNSYHKMPTSHLIKKPIRPYWYHKAVFKPNQSDVIPSSYINHKGKGGWGGAKNKQKQLKTEDIFSH